MWVGGTVRTCATRRVYSALNSLVSSSKAFINRFTASEAACSSTRAPSRACRCKGVEGWRVGGMQRCHMRQSTHERSWKAKQFGLHVLASVHAITIYPRCPPATAHTLCPLPCLRPWIVWQSVCCAACSDDWRNRRNAYCPC